MLRRRALRSQLRSSSSSSWCSSVQLCVPRWRRWWSGHVLVLAAAASLCPASLRCYLDSSGSIQRFLRPPWTAASLVCRLAAKLTVVPPSVVLAAVGLSGRVHVHAGPSAGMLRADGDAREALCSVKKAFIWRVHQRVGVSHTGTHTDTHTHTHGHTATRNLLPVFFRSSANVLQVRAKLAR